MLINLRVRIQQKWFWLTLIPLLFLLADQVYEVVQVLATMTVQEALTGGMFKELVLGLVGTVFAVLALIGFPVDTTTSGYGDSVRALTYTEPAPNAAELAEEIYADALQKNLSGADTDGDVVIEKED